MRSAKYLLQPTQRQSQALDHLVWQQRRLYNQALEQRKKAWEEESRSITRYEQFASLNGLADKDLELARYGICVARGTLTRLDLAFKAFYRRCGLGQKPGYPRFKGRCRFHSVSWPDASGWKLDTKARRFYAMGVGFLKVRLHRSLPGRPKTAELKREGRRWWVVIHCDQVPAKALPPTGKAVGLDLGVAHTLTTSEGVHITNPRPTTRGADGLAGAQRALARKKKGSKRRRRCVERVAAHHRKIARCRADHAHKVSRSLVNAYDLIVHEDLRIENMVRSAKGSIEAPGTNVAAKSGLNRSIHDAGWGQLLHMMAYKAEEAGRALEAVSPHNTSRTCSSCGHCEAGNRLTQAKFQCLGCGHVAHADENAAINILRAGLAQRVLREAGSETVA